MAEVSCPSASTSADEESIVEEDHSLLFLSFALNHLVPLSATEHDDIALSTDKDAQLPAPSGSRRVVIGSVADDLILPEHMSRAEQSKVVTSRVDYILVSECLLVTRNSSASAPNELIFEAIPAEEAGNVRLQCIDAEQCQKYGCDLIFQESSAMLSSSSDIVQIGICVIGTTETAASKHVAQETLDNDITQGITLDVWPEQCVSFVRRQGNRKWPNRVALQAVLHEKIILAPLTYAKITESDDTSLWTYWFCMAEKRLATFLSTNQRQLFSILKLINVYLFGKLGVPTRILKHVFFWFCERSDTFQWNISFLGRNLLRLLTGLKNELKENNISNYFMPTTNLLCNCILENRVQTVERLEKFLETPLQLISQLDEAVLLPHSLTVSRHSDIFSLLWSLQPSDSSDMIRHQIIPATVKIAEALLVQNLIHQQKLGFSSFAVVDKCYELSKYFMETVLHSEFLPSHFIDLLVRFIDPDLVAHYLAAKTRECPNDTDIALSCNNLACQLAIKAHEETSNRSQVLKSLAQMLHEAVLISDYSSPATLIDHAKMHLSFGETEAAVPLFKAACHSSSKSSSVQQVLEHLNCFDATEQALLCTPLRGEVQRHGSVTLPASSLALFHLVWLHGAAAHTHLQELRRECELLQHVTEPCHRHVASCALSLLAHCYRSLGDPVSAEVASQDAQQLADEDIYPAEEVTCVTDEVTCAADEVDQVTCLTEQLQVE